MSSLTTRLAEIKERLEKSTPGPYDARVREFSNHALCEVWTEFGWYQQLPRDYREPTTEMFAFAPSDLQLLVRVCSLLICALKAVDENAEETLAEIEELCGKGEE